MSDNARRRDNPWSPNPQQDPTLYPSTVQHPQPDGGGSSGSSGASPEAWAYFNSFSPAEQATIRASWGGADLMEQWYQNAKAAGATHSPVGTGVGSTQAPGGQAPAGSIQNPTPEWLRWYAANNGWSEDFARFDNNTLQHWINNYWDPSRGLFRSEWANDPRFSGEEDFQNWRGQKPNETPEGWTMHGSAPVRWSSLPWELGGTGTAAPSAGTPQAQPSGLLSGTDELTDYLAQSFNNRSGIFGASNPFGPSYRGGETQNPYLLSGQLLEGGGLWWGQPGYRDSLTSGLSEAVSSPQQPQASAPATRPWQETVNLPSLPNIGEVAPPVDPGWSNPSTTPLAQAVAAQFDDEERRKKQWWEV